MDYTQQLLLKSCLFLRASFIPFHTTFVWKNTMTWKNKTIPVHIKWKVTSFSWSFLWLLSLSQALFGSGVAVEERRENYKLFTRYSHINQLQGPCKSISFCHLLSILLLNLCWHLLLVITLCHLLSQFLHLLLQVAFLCHQLSHFLLYIDEALQGGSRTTLLNHWVISALKVRMKNSGSDLRMYVLISIQMICVYAFRAVLVL